MGPALLSDLTVTPKDLTLASSNEVQAVVAAAGEEGDEATGTAGVNVDVIGIDHLDRDPEDPGKFMAAPSQARWKALEEAGLVKKVSRSSSDRRPPLDLGEISDDMSEDEKAETHKHNADVIKARSGKITERNKEAADNHLIKKLKKDNQELVAHDQEPAVPLPGDRLL